MRLDDTSAADWYALMVDRIEIQLGQFWNYDSGDTETGHWLATTFGEGWPGEAILNRARDRNSSSRVTSGGSSDGDAPFPESLTDLESSINDRDNDKDDGGVNDKHGVNDYVSDSSQQWIEYGRTGLDCAFPMCVIHAGTLYPDTTKSWTSFEPTHPSVLGTLHRYILSFDGLYAINAGRKWTDGWALGRYAEDVYDGVGQSLAHPWSARSLLKFVIKHS